MKAAVRSSSPIVSGFDSGDDDGDGEDADSVDKEKVVEEEEEGESSSPSSNILCFLRHSFRSPLWSIIEGSVKRGLPIGV